MCSRLLRLIFFVSLTGIPAMHCLCQSNKKNGKEVYFSLGSHRSFFSHSDIHLRSPGFDFTLYDVHGKDDGGFNFRNGAPQYNYAIGYYNHRAKWGIEFGFDHVKYYIRQNQRVHMKGTIGNDYFNTDTLLLPSFVQFEHSDGANYALLKFLKWIPLSVNKKYDNALQLLFKAGAGPVIPKTNSTVMGRHRDDRYNIAGYVFAGEAGVRYPFTRFLFAEAGMKAAYANYKKILIANGTGDQKWFGLHFHILIGAAFAWHSQ
jgi:hypothetical protein